MNTEVYRSEDGTYPAVGGGGTANLYDIRGNMKSEDLDAWIEALESGDWEQGSGELCNASDEYCCLGVHLELNARRKFDTEPDREMYWEDNRDGEMLEASYLVEHGFVHSDSVSGSGSDLQNFLANANDNGWTFMDIARFLNHNRYWITGEWRNAESARDPQSDHA